MSATRTPARSGAQPRCRSGRTPRPTSVRHGQGYSRFEHTSHGIALDLLQFVPLEDPVKISRLTIENRSGTAAAPLGDRVRRVGARRLARARPRRSSSPRSIRTRGRCWRATPGTPISAIGSPSPTSAGARRRGPATGRSSSAPRHASIIPRCWSAGTARPDGSGAGLDPCAALQTLIELPPGGRERGRVLPRPGRRRSMRRAPCSTRYRARGPRPGPAQAVRTQWDDIVGAVQVKTPDRSMDLMLNRWLLYQTLACRVWARSAFYQAGGAYGFRDQLQDVMALTVAERGRRARAPPAGRGAPVRGGRRPALVASALRPGCADTDLRRPRLAAVRRRPLRGSHRRCRGAGRGRPLPRGAGRWRRGRTNAYFQPTVSDGARPRCSSTAPAPSTGASPSARTASP